MMRKTDISQPRSGRNALPAAGVLGTLMLGVNLVFAPGAMGQPSDQTQSEVTTRVMEFTAPVEDINFVSEDIDGGAQVEEAEDYEILRLSADVNFAKDSAKLSSQATKILNDAAAKWKDKDITTIEVTGHTDSVQGKVENNKLSRDRAAAVEKVLKKKFPDAKISSTGKGPSEPRAEEVGLKAKELEKARAMNRRVEIVVSFPKTD